MGHVKLILSAISGFLYLLTALRFTYISSIPLFDRGTFVVINMIFAIFNLLAVRIENKIQFVVILGISIMNFIYANTILIKAEKNQKIDNIG